MKNETNAQQVLGTICCASNGEAEYNLNASQINSSVFCKVRFVEKMRFEHRGQGSVKSLWKYRHAPRLGSFEERK